MTTTKTTTKSSAGLVSAMVQHALDAGQPGFNASAANDTPSSSEDKLRALFMRTPGIHPQAFENYMALRAADDDDDDGEITGDQKFKMAGDGVVLVEGVIVSNTEAEIISKWFDIKSGYTSPSMVREMLGAVDGEFEVEINSPGGDVFAGNEIFYLLEQAKPTAAVVTGIAASMGAMLMLTAPERVAGTDLSMAMFHAPWTVAIGNATELEKQVASLRQIENGFIRAIDRRMPSEGAAQVEKAIRDGDDLYLTAAEMLESGIVSEIRSNASAGAGDDGGKTGENAGENKSEKGLQKPKKSDTITSDTTIAQRQFITITAMQLRRAAA